MRVQRLHVDGFGRFHDQPIGPLAKPVTVLLGENEAGKSTLLAFIRAVLFGFPARGRDEHYPPFNGGRHGGRLVLLGEDGVERTVERYAGAKGGAVSVTGADGSTGEDHVLRALLGHVSKGLFEKVFTFGIDELHALDSFQSDDVRSLIYSAGMGVPNLAQTERELREQQQALYQPRGSAQEVSSILKQLEDIEGRLRQHANDAVEYAGLTGRIQTLATEVAQSETERAVLSEHAGRIDRFQKAWEPLVGFRMETVRLNSIPVYEAFPQDPVGRLEALNGRVQEAQERATKAEVALATAVELAERPLQGGRLLDDARAIDQAVERRGSLADSIRDLPEREGELRVKGEALQHGLEDLGPGWDSSRVQSFNTSLPVRDAASRHEEALDQAARTLDGARIAVATARQETDDAARGEADAQRALEAAPAPAQDERGIDARRGALLRARGLLDTLERETQERTALEAQAAAAEEAAQAAPPARPWLTSGALLAGAAAFGVGGIAGQVQPMFAGILAAVLVVAALILLFIRSPAPTAAAANPGLQAQLDLAHRRETDTGIRLTEAGRELGLDAVDSRSLDLAEADLEAAVRVLSQRQSLHHDLERASQEHRRRAGQLETAQQGLAAAQNAQGTGHAAWEAWLATQSLPASLSPNGALGLLTRVQALRTETGAVAELEHRVRAIRQDIEEASALVAPLAQRHGVPAQPQQSASLLSAIDALRKALEEAREEAVLRRGQEQARKDAEAQAEEERRLLAAAVGERDALLRSGGTDDEEEFRRRAAAVAEREACAQAREDCLRSIRAIFGPAAEPAPLLEEAAAMTPESLATEGDDVHERLKASNARVAALHEERGMALSELERLSSEQEASVLRAERAVLVESLRDAAERWAEITLARGVLQLAREGYEHNRKPAVIQDAEAFFSRITQGRYPHLHAPLGSETVGARLASGEPRGPEQLSRGTREQLHLALRFGVIRDFNRQGACLPVVLDDALVNFDPKRAAAAARAFTELAETNQVLVFTCHPHIAALFAEQSSDTTAVLRISEEAAAPANV